MRKSSRAAASSSVSVIISSVTIHLRSGKERAQVTCAKVVAARAATTASATGTNVWTDPVLAANVCASPDLCHQNVQEHGRNKNATECHIAVRWGGSEKVQTERSSSDGPHDLERGPCPSAIANRRTDPVQIHAGHNLAEKTHIAPNRHAHARVKAARLATVKNPVPPGTSGDMMPACRIILVNKRRTKRNAFLNTALGLHMNDRTEESVLDIS
jgi:hypothetical protein